MKVSLGVNDQGTGCAAVISGCGVGGHEARLRFLAPEYGPVEISFDGDEVRYERDVLHGEVIATVVDSEDFWDQHASLEAAVADDEQPKRRGARRSEPEPPEPEPTAGAVSSVEETSVDVGGSDGGEDE